MGVSAQLVPGSLYRLYQRFLTVGARTRELSLKGSPTWLFAGLTVAFVLIVPTMTIAAEAQTNRMTVEYVPPTNPAR
jgi:hypothetical protein